MRWWGIGVLLVAGTASVALASYADRVPALARYPLLLLFLGALAAVGTDLLKDRVSDRVAERERLGRTARQAVWVNALGASRRGRLPKVRSYPHGPDARGRGRGGEAVYVARDADGEVDEALSARGAVLLQGPSASGKTRTAWEAVLRLAAGEPSLRLLVPVAADSLTKLADAGVRLHDTIVWLDDLETYLGQGRLDLGALTRLADGDGIRVVATIRTRARAGLGTEDGALTRSAREVLGALSPVRLRRELTRTELVRAEEHRDDPMIEAALGTGPVVRLAEYLAGGMVALDRWRRGEEGEQAEGAALVSAAVYARALGHLNAFTQDALRRLAVHFLERPATAPADALAWATTVEDDVAACLGTTADGLLQPLDYLVDHVQGEPFDHLPDAFWRTVHDFLAPEDILLFAANARRHGRPDLALSALRRGTAERPGDTALLFALGTLLWDDDDPEEAETLFRAAAALPAAANSLAALLLARGDDAEAAAFFRKAADAGDVEAGNNLGCLLLGESDREAEQYFRAAAARPEAMNNLAVVLSVTGRTAEAEGWFRNALSSGLAAIRNNYGLHLAETGAYDRAERELREAVGDGAQVAQDNLDQVLQRLHGLDTEPGHVALILLGTRTAADGSTVSFPVPRTRESRIEVPGPVPPAETDDPWAGRPGLYVNIAAASPYSITPNRSRLFDELTAARVRLRGTGDPYAARRRWVGPPGDQVVGRRHGEEFSFLLLGSTGGVGGPSQYAVVPGMLQVGADTDFMIICGDVLQPSVNLGSAGAGFFAPFRAYQAPIYAVPGEQDWRDGLVEFMQVFCGRALPAAEDTPALTDARRLRSATAQEALQPGPYWVIDSPGLRIVGIDTGIQRSIDRDQGEWLRRVSADPRPKLLITGKPIYADDRYYPCPIEGGGTVSDIVQEFNYVAVIGGDIHNYQRYPVMVYGGDGRRRTVEHVVAGGAGAFMHATHTIGRTSVVTEHEFDCYPLRGDSLVFYSRLYGRRLGLQRFFDIGYQEAASAIAQRLGTHQRGAENIRPGLRARFIAVLLGVPRGMIKGGLSMFRLPVHRAYERFFSETARNAPPPLFKSFLRVDVRPGEMHIRCYGATGYREHEVNPPLLTEVRVPLR